MTRLRLVLAALLVAALAFTLAACGDDDSADSASTDTTASSDVACTKDQLATLSAGTLTVGTDKPAFPPYVDRRRPHQRQGLRERRRLRGRRAARLHEGRGQVDRRALQLVLRARARRSSTSTSTRSRSRPARAKAVDFSTPYYTTPQAVLVPEGLPVRHRHDRSPTSRTRSFGVQVGTTSLDAVNEVIAPSSSRGLQRLQRRRARAQVRAGGRDRGRPARRRSTCATPRWRARKVVGQFEAPGGDDWGAACWRRARRSPPCVDQALTALKDSGELAQITDQWIGAEAPVLALKCIAGAA